MPVIRLSLNLNLLEFSEIINGKKDYTPKTSNDFPALGRVNGNPGVQLQDVLWLLLLFMSNVFKE